MFPPPTVHRVRGGRRRSAGAARAGRPAGCRRRRACGDVHQQRGDRVVPEPGSQGVGEAAPGGRCRTPSARRPWSRSTVRLQRPIRRPGPPPRGYSDPTGTRAWSAGRSPRRRAGPPAARCACDPVGDVRHGQDPYPTGRFRHFNPPHWSRSATAIEVRAGRRIRASWARSRRSTSAGEIPSGPGATPPSRQARSAAVRRFLVSAARSRRHERKRGRGRRRLPGPPSRCPPRVGRGSRRSSLRGRRWGGGGGGPWRCTRR